MNEAPAWWTPADQAELDVLIWELVRAGFAHDERCAVCRSLPPGFFCEPLRDAIEAVLDWRRGRMLLSRAAKARRAELMAELGQIREALAA